VQNYTSLPATLDGLQAPSQTRIAVAPESAFCYAYNDHKGSPCGSGAGDGAPAKVLSSALFFCLYGVNAGDLGSSTVRVRPEAPKPRVQTTVYLSQDFRKKQLICSYSLCQLFSYSLCQLFSYSFCLNFWRNIIVQESRLKGNDLYLKGFVTPSIKGLKFIWYLNFIIKNRPYRFLGKFPQLFAFKEGMWDTRISATLNSPAVSLRFPPHPWP
jgi:hypothetical protein